MIIRVDTYENELDSVLLKLAVAPYTLINTFSGAAITHLGNGAYTIDVGDITGQWMVILLDPTPETLGIKYAGNDYPQAFDYPPWLLNESITGELVVLTIRDTSANIISGALAYITTDEAGAAVIRSNMVSNQEGKIYTFLEPGTYYAWITHANYTGINPIQIIVEDV